MEDSTKRSGNAGEHHNSPVVSGNEKITLDNAQNSESEPLSADATVEKQEQTPASEPAISTTAQQEVGEVRTPLNKADGNPFGLKPQYKTAMRDFFVCIAYREQVFEELTDITIADI